MNDPRPAPCSEDVDVDGFAAGLLDSTRHGATAAHLLDCPPCREGLVALEQARERYRDAPPELFIDGPPDGGDLLLARTLRAVRTEARATRRRRGALTVAAGVVAVAVAVSGGALVRGAGDSGTAVAGVDVSPGALVFTGADPGSGAELTVSAAPAAGWVRLDASARGVPEGTRCTLVAVARDGDRVVAGSWLVSADGAASGTSVRGSALVAPADLAGVELRTEGGELLVAARL